MSPDQLGKATAEAEEEGLGTTFWLDELELPEVVMQGVVPLPAGPDNAGAKPRAGVVAGVASPSACTRPTPSPDLHPHADPDPRFVGQAFWGFPRKIHFRALSMASPGGSQVLKACFGPLAAGFGPLEACFGVLAP